MDSGRQGDRETTAAAEPIRLTQRTGQEDLGHPAGRRLLLRRMAASDRL